MKCLFLKSTQLLPYFTWWIIKEVVLFVVLMCIICGKQGRCKLHNLINYAVVCKAVCYIKISFLSYMTHVTLSQIFKNESGPWLFPEFFYSVMHAHMAGIFPRAGLGWGGRSELSFSCSLTYSLTMGASWVMPHHLWILLYCFVVEFFYYKDKRFSSAT